MSGYKKLWYGGYGKYKYYVVAEDKEQALEVIRDKYNMRALPVDAVEINNIDGYIIIPVLESELDETDIELKESVKQAIQESEFNDGIGYNPEDGMLPTKSEKQEMIDKVDSLSRAELLQIAKQLNIDGKIATFKTEDLREKVGDKLGATEKESGASN